MTNNDVIARDISKIQAFKITASDSNYFLFTNNPATDSDKFVQVVEIFEVGGQTPPNEHTAADEGFFVLKGEGYAECNGERIPLKAGCSFLVRAGHEHIVVNTGSTRLYCLTTMVPNEAFAEMIQKGIPWEIDQQDIACLQRTAL